jgi:hypothetical protein
MALRFSGRFMLIQATWFLVSTIKGLLSLMGASRVLSMFVEASIYADTVYDCGFKNNRD